MRRRYSTKTIIGYIVICILALVLSIAAVGFLPIPGDYKRLAFFLLIPAIAAIGVFIISIVKRK